MSPPSSSDCSGPDDTSGPVTPASVAQVEALAAHVQALEGVRRLHLDLAERLAAGEALRGRVDEMSDGLHEVRAEQRELNRRLEEDRLRADARRGGRAAWVVLLLVAFGLGSVWAWERWADEVPLFKSWRRQGASSTQRALAQRVAADSGLEGQRADDESRAAQALAPSTPRAAPPGSTGEATTYAELESLRQRAESAEAQLTSARNERNKQLGESSQLRQALIEKQMQLDEAMKGVSAVVADAQLRRANEPVRVSSSVQRAAELDLNGSVPLVTRVNAALKASGLRDLKVVEVGSIQAGALSDLIVMDSSENQELPLIQSIPRAELSEERGVVSLVFTEHLKDPESRLEGEVIGGAPSLNDLPVRASAPGGLSFELPEGLTEGVEQSAGSNLETIAPEGPVILARHPLPNWDREAWERVGVAVPLEFISTDVVEQSLRDLLEIHHYELVSVGGFQAGELQDVVLRQLAPDGQVLRTFRAQRGVLEEEGPELVLSGGTVTEGDQQRDFWRGQSRLPLPGSNYAAWAEVIGG